MPYGSWSTIARHRVLTREQRIRSFIASAMASRHYGPRGRSRGHRPPRRRTRWKQKKRHHLCPAVALDDVKADTHDLAVETCMRTLQRKYPAKAKTPSLTDSRAGAATAVRQKDRSSRLSFDQLTTEYSAGFCANQRPSTGDAFVRIGCHEVE